MALENVSSFQYWPEDIRNTKSGPEKDLRALNCLIPEANMALGNVGLFQLRG